MRILIVEDDLALSDVLAFTLRRAGFQVDTVHDGISAVTRWQETQPDLVLLDLNLPRLDGLAVCRRIRAHSNIPIVILTVRGGDEAVVQGLDLGADDYMVKPFSPSELVARLRAVLRRTGVTPRTGLLEAAGLTLDRSRNEVRREDGEVVHLTPLEARLLETFMLNAGDILSSEALSAAVWGPEGASRAMLKQLVYRLRSKVELSDAPLIRIETVAGVGYGLVPVGSAL